MRRFGIPTLLLLAITAVAFMDLMPRFLGWSANKILANAVNPLDLEAPITAFNPKYSPARTSVLGGGGTGLGCSIPKPVELATFGYQVDQQPIKLQMRQACVFHDYCYRHGAATYGLTQSQCDFLLQEHAFRLCSLSVAPTDAFAFSDCQTNARKVTLGVRTFGAKPFRRADDENVVGASSYFEFHPYPLQSQYHATYRIADAPQVWQDSGSSKKAMYRFRITPSGMRVAIVTLETGSTKFFCTEMELSGKYNQINSSPQIAVDGPNGDVWFVWWHRKDMGNTLGQMSALVPRFASLDDWTVIADNVKEVGCYRDNDYVATQPSLTGSQRPDGLAAAATYKPMDRDFSQLQPLSDKIRDGIIRVAGQTTRPCNQKRKNVSTCLIAFSLKLGTDMVKTQPLVGVQRFVTRRKNCIGDARRNCNQYRDLALQPFALPGSKVPGLGWFRRDDAYENETQLLVHEIEDIGKDGPPLPANNPVNVVMKDLKQEDEPVAILKDKIGNTALLSVRAGYKGFFGGKGEIEISRWSAPSADNVKQANRQRVCSGLTVRNSWLSRPAQIIQRENGVDILLTRYDFDEEDQFLYDADRKKHYSEINITSMIVHVDGDHCYVSYPELIGVLKIPNKSRDCLSVSKVINNGTKKTKRYDIMRLTCLRKTAKSVNQRAILVADLLPYRQSIIIPHYKRSPSSYIFNHEAISAMRLSLRKVEN